MMEDLFYVRRYDKEQAKKKHVIIDDALQKNNTYSRGKYRKIIARI